MFRYSGELFTRFREEIVKNHGGINCRDITGVDWTKPEQVQAYFKGEKFVECQRIVGDTAKFLGELLERLAVRIRKRIEMTSDFRSD